MRGAILVEMPAAPWAECHAPTPAERHGLGPRPSLAEVERRDWWAARIAEVVLGCAAGAAVVLALLVL